MRRYIMGSRQPRIRRPIRDVSAATTARLGLQIRLSGDAGLADTVVLDVLRHPGRASGAQIGMRARADPPQRLKSCRGMPTDGNCNDLMTSGGPTSARRSRSSVSEGSRRDKVSGTRGSCERPGYNTMRLGPLPSQSRRAVWLPEITERHERFAYTCFQAACLQVNLGWSLRVL